MDESSVSQVTVGPVGPVEGAPAVPAGGGPALAGAAAGAVAGAAAGAVSDQPATIYDVARVAGVSHQTVSRYLKGYQGIRPPTRERVAAALQTLNYRPNLTARSLITGRSHRLGALTHDVDQVGPSRIARGASTAAREAGYLLDVVTLDASDPGSIEEALDLVTRHDLAGILALASTDEMTKAFEATDFRMPAFIAAERNDQLRAHPDDLIGAGFPRLFAHLTELGHRRFLHIAGPMTWVAARNRAGAYEAAVSTGSRQSAGILQGDWSARSGYEAITGIRGDVDATAVVAANDQMALGAMLALTERGLRVPEDVSVTGVDDIPEAAYLSPPLTTLRLDFAAQGRAAVVELLNLVDHGTPPSPIVQTSEFMVRRSTGPAPGTG